MSSRERKRAERRKRIERSERKAAEQGGGVDGDAVDLAALAAEVAPAASEPEPEESASERRNREAREQLEPLAEGERPLVVTLGAAASAIIATSIVVAWATGADINAFETFPTAVLFAIMAAGMWRARYWAVLGFEAVMAFIVIIAFLNMLVAPGAVEMIGPLLVMVAAGAFFWFTVKALARIQMPVRDPRV